MSTSTTFCGFCQKEFISLRAYNLHAKFRHNKDSKEETNSKSHKCEQCQRFFESYAKYQVHIKLKHKNFRVQCSKCSETFLWRHHLDEHLETHGDGPTSTLDQSQSKRGAEEVSKDEPKIEFYNCDFCDKSYVRLGNLQKHIKTKHRNKLSKTYFLRSRLTFIRIWICNIDLIEEEA